MAIAQKLKAYLDNQSIDYQILPHAHTHCSMETAASAHVPGAQLAKAVVLSHEDGYFMVVIPSPEHVALGSLHKQLERHVGLATEAELEKLFPDCELGAIPALGDAYGIETLWDTNLTKHAQIFLEGGDHENVVRISGESLQPLMARAKKGDFCCHH